MEDYIDFGDVARDLIGMQCQYASQYIKGTQTRPCLGNGLRFLNLDSFSYHEIQIHKDDVDEFVARVKAHRGMTTR